MKIPNKEELKGGKAGPNWMKMHYPEFYNNLMSLYEGFELTFSERLYWYYNNLSEKPVCEVCGGPVGYINLNLGYQKCCSRVCSNRSKSKKDKIKEICIEKYGGMGFQSEAIKEKAKETCQEKYGVDNPMLCDEFQKKAKQTYIERYGGLAAASKEIQEKMKQTNLERYGVENPMYNSDIATKCQESVQKTLMSKYGVNNAFKIQSVKDRIKQTMLERYGVEYYVQSPDCTKPRNESIYNEAFKTLLEQYNIEYSKEFPLGNYRYDFKVGDTLIEINPYPTHNSTWAPYGKPKDKMYHLNKAKVARDNDYRCISVWDWDNPEKIVRSLVPKTKMYARECQIDNDISQKETDEFLNEYHFQGTCRGQKIRIGLRDNNGDLMEIMTFGKARYNKNCEWELLRLCSKNGINAIGGASKIFKEFVSTHEGSIVSYCDLSKFDGNIYKQLGFEPKNINPNPSLHWYDGNRHITNNLLKMKGFDKLFGTNYGKGTSNIELMLQNRFVEIWDCGQTTWIYKNI